MTTKTEPSTENVPVRILLKTERLEPYLKFPSGLTVKQAKQNAKALKKLQDISQSEAMKIICWGNGLIDVRDFSQAIPKLIKSTFELEHNEFGVYKTDENYHGFWYMSDDEVKVIRIGSAKPNTVESLTERLTEHLASLKEYKVKKVRFLQAVKDCIRSIGHQFYTTRNNIPLDNVIDLYEIDIDVKKLLFEGGGSSGQATMEYALGSCYNTNYTAREIMQKALEVKYSNDGDSQFDISDNHQRRELTGFTSDSRQFGAICYNLDASNKDIIKRLLDNYHGW
jgi:hypothetical protein